MNFSNLRISDRYSLNFTPDVYREAKRDKSLHQRCCRAADLRQYESGLISSSFLSSAFLCEAAHLLLYTLDNNLVVCQRLQSDYRYGRREPENLVSCFSPTSSPLPSRFYDDYKGSRHDLPKRSVHPWRILLFLLRITVARRIHFMMFFYKSNSLTKLKTDFLRSRPKLEGKRWKYVSWTRSRLQFK